MNKKTRSILILLMLVALCLVALAGCKQEKVSIFADPEEDLHFVGKLIRWMHKGIGNYGWTVVVFTVALKLIMLPLDIWQRYSARKSAVKMKQMQPLVEEIDRRYGQNTQRANEEKQKLYKKQGSSMLTQCLPMVISMAVFFVMFAGLRSYSSFSNIQTFNELSNTYHNTYVTEIVANGGEIETTYKQAYDKSYAASTANHPDYTEAQKVLIAQGQGIAAVNGIYKTEAAAAQKVAVEAVKDRYVGNEEKGIEGIRESWLWIQSVWQPDTWDTIMPQYSGTGMFATNSFSTTIDMNGYPNAESTYNIIRNAVLETGTRADGGKWNGLMILPILSVGLSFLSMFISQLMEKKGKKGEQVPQQNAQQAATNKTMLILMPLMMAWFGFMYTGAFAIYMVVNYTLGIISTLALRIPVEKMVQKNLAKADKKQGGGKASYMR